MCLCVHALLSLRRILNIRPSEGGHFLQSEDVLAVCHLHTSSLVVELWFQGERNSLRFLGGVGPMFNLHVQQNEEITDIKISLGRPQAVLVCILFCCLGVACFSYRMVLHATFKCIFTLPHSGTLVAATTSHQRLSTGGPLEDFCDVAKRCPEVVTRCTLPTDHSFCGMS